MAPIWTWTAAAYKASFARLCAGTIPTFLEFIGRPAAPGSRMLDVGTGTGAVATAAAQEGFQVEAVDSEPTMIEYAREQHSLSNIAFSIGRLPNLDFASGTFEALAANFVVNHTMDPRAAMAEIGRVMALGAPMGVTIWPSAISPMNALWNLVMDSAGAIRPSGMRLAPEKDFARTPDGLRTIITEGEFVEIDVFELTWTFRITPDDHWRAPLAGIATVGETYGLQDAATKARMYDAFAELTIPLLIDGELALPTTAIIATALRAG
jgi:2-polyprenyl-3-methyl-5-hydroxy-6-metoxy-1,4-benzoquinol methylase